MSYRSLGYSSSSSSSDARRRGGSPRCGLDLDSSLIVLEGPCEAARCVGALLGCSSRISYRSCGRAFSILSFAGNGLGPLRTEAPRLIVFAGLAPDLSASGGGVGGNTLRLMGGSDCCRLL